MISDGYTVRITAVHVRLTLIVVLPPGLFAYGKVVLYEGKPTVVCNLHSLVKLSTGNHYGYIKRDRWIADNIPMATTYGLAMAFLRAVPPIRVKVYRVRWSSQVFTKTWFFPQNVNSQTANLIPLKRKLDSTKRKLDSTKRESSLRLVESSLRFVNSSFYRKNQVFVNACELGGAKVQVTGHMSQVIVLIPIEKASQTLVKANLRPN